MFLLAFLIATPGLASAEADLLEVRQAIPAQIDAWEGNLTDEEHPQWKEDVELLLHEWLAFRDVQCAPPLLRADTAPELCPGRITRLIASDLRVRYGLDEKADSRPSFDGTLAPAHPDPCEHAPPGDCDYCGVNLCWEQVLKRQDVTLNRVYRAALARSGARAGKLRESQRLWLTLRDHDCDLESWETPNRFAHSMYSLQFAPCIENETAARIVWLSQIFRRP